jgi:hypothetical protein
VRILAEEPFIEQSRHYDPIIASMSQMATQLQSQVAAEAMDEVMKNA